MTTTDIGLGEFKQWEWPGAFTVSFTQNDATTPLALTGLTSEASWCSETEPASTPFACTVTDAANGLVEVPTPEAAFDAVGRHWLEVWVGDGTVRYGTVSYTYTVVPSLVDVKPTLP